MSEEVKHHPKRNAKAPTVTVAPEFPLNVDYVAASANVAIAEPAVVTPPQPAIIAAPEPTPETVVVAPKLHPRVQAEIDAGIRSLAKRKAQG